MIALTLYSAIPIRSYEVTKFRGAVASSVPQGSFLFHNHVGERYRYGYPFIQYKSLGGKAAIVCVGEGVRHVWEVFEQGQLTISLGHRQERLIVENIEEEAVDIQCADALEYAYSISDWLPLNASNYEEYLSEPSLMARTVMLERILRGNILSMLKGCGIFLEDELKVSITSLSQPKAVKFKNVQLMAFNASFLCNLPLPQNIGLGRHVSIGFGTLSNASLRKK